MFLHQIASKKRLRDARKPMPDGLVGIAGDIRHDVGNLFGRKKPREKMLGVIRRDHQPGTSGEIAGEFLDHILDDRHRDNTQFGDRAG